VKENVDYLRDENYSLCVQKYEEFYGKPMAYDIVNPTSKQSEEQTTIL
jgi:hypothetical protein